MWNGIRIHSRLMKDIAVIGIKIGSEHKNRSENSKIQKSLIFTKVTLKIWAYEGHKKRKKLGN